MIMKEIILDLVNNATIFDLVVLGVLCWLAKLYSDYELKRDKQYYDAYKEWLKK